VRYCLAAVRAATALAPHSRPKDGSVGWCIAQRHPSSLSALRLFPIDSLKIDRSFVNGVPHNTDDSAIAAAVIALGQTLGVNVIAEGIERPEQLAFFTDHRCAEWQGYLLVSPQTAEQCEALLFGDGGALELERVSAAFAAR